jgi:uncharacterized pyridoxamine 5'-phosphate oxidase family protein
MRKSTEIALATSVDNIPRVRVVSFVYDENKPGVVYFSTRRQSAKILDFRENNHVAFTTFEKEHVRVRSATIEESNRDENELKALMIKKIPHLKDIFEMAGDNLVFFEIHFDTATLYVNMEQPEILYF